mgnify:CR=1 FL=1|jgi:hypothetical protein
MAQQLINTGIVPNDGTGQTLRTAFQKVNSNFTELYGNIAGTPEATANTVVQRDENGDIAVNAITYRNSYANQLAFPSANADVNTGTVVYSESDQALFYSNGSAWVRTIDNKSNTVSVPNDITVAGVASIGNTTITANTVLSLTSTTGALLLPRMSTTQRDAMTAVNGMLIYNTTVNKFQGYGAGAWGNIALT